MPQCDERVIQQAHNPFIGSGFGLHQCQSLSAGNIRNMLRVKLLEAGARAPVVAHPGEDLGYDVFALEGVTLAPRATVKVRTGIAVEARDPHTGAPLGLLVRDRSSMAARGIATTGGVIDSGYRGEILVLMTNLGDMAVEFRPARRSRKWCRYLFSQVRPRSRKRWKPPCARKRDLAAQGAKLAC